MFFVCLIPMIAIFLYTLTISLVIVYIEYHFLYDGCIHNINTYHVDFYNITIKRP